MHSDTLFGKHMRFFSDQVTAMTRCVIGVGVHGVCLCSCMALLGFTSRESLAQEVQPAESDVHTLTYNRDIRPLLADKCFSCHGPDSASREADLRLDKRDAAIERGALVPHEPDASEFIDRIMRAEDDDMAMPPAEGHKRLTAEQKEMLVQWVREGAEYELHWSLTPPVRAEIPATATDAWVKNPIDAFVLKKLQDVGLEPAEAADRRTIARRLALDLTGLPPTPAQIEAFLADTSPDYYERYVDYLLESSRWGEHRARYWLDYARYADTHGIHFDNFREVWAYRDWVINAFNRNLPFDQFSTEQIAGDLLPEPTMDQLIATGFSRCNITTNEGGVIQEEYKVLYARDRTETMSTVFLGLTTGCAVCHDHKFDPFTQRDFYSLSAFFNNTTQPVMDGNIHNTPPIIPVPRLEDRQRWEALGGELAAARQMVAQTKDAARTTFETESGQLDANSMLESMPHGAMQFHAPLSNGAGPAVIAWNHSQLSQAIAAADFAWAAGHTFPASLQVSAEATAQWKTVGDLERDTPFSVAAWIWLPSDNTGGSIVARMDEAAAHRGWDLWLEGNRLGTHLINQWPENAIKVVTNNPLPKETWTHVAMTYDGSSKAEGVQFYVNGQLRTDRNVANDNLSESMRTPVAFKLGTRNNSARVTGMRLNDVRIYGETLEAAQCNLIASVSRASYLVARPLEIRTDAEKEELFAWWLAGNPGEFRQAVNAEQQLVAEQEAIKQRGTIAHVMNEATSEAEAFMLARGEYDQRGDRVTANTPSILPAMSPDLPKNRLGLARWLFDPQNPLTARVTVNRFWQEVFGAGLVSSTGDFGITGDIPSHPELLDYLAIEFRESGWDVKELFRLMVTSATYRQTAFAKPEKRELDPQNRLLSRGTRYRMDAEMVRDNALFVTDLLSPKIGGASVRPYQPEGVWEAVAMPGSNTRDYVADSGEGLYRRSMYTFWKRSAPPASMDIMNAPSRETCTVRRERTNTPLQALVTLNDPQYLEAARQMATLAIGAASEPQDRVNFILMRLLGRNASAAEWPIVANSLATLSAYYAEHAEDAAAILNIGQLPVAEGIEPAELASWTMLCNQLMNLDEVLNK